MQSISHLGRYSRAVKLYLLSCVAFGIGTGIFDLVYNLHLLEIGFSPTDIGTLYLISFSIMGLAAIPAGVLADYFGRRWFLVGGSLLFGVTMLLIPCSSHFAFLAVIQGLNSLGGIMMFTTEHSTMSGEVNSEERTSLFSVIFITVLVADGVGTLAGGQLPGLFPDGPLSHYQITLFISGFIGILISMIRFFMPLRPESIGGHVIARSVIPKAPMLKLALLAFLVGGSAALSMRYINVVFEARYGLDASILSFVLIAEKAVSFLGALSTPYIARRWGSAQAAVLAMAVILPLQVWAGLSVTVLMFIVPYLACQALHYSQMPVLETFATGSLDPAERSTMSSYREVGFFLGSAFCAKLYGSLLSDNQFDQAFMLSGALAACAGMCYYMFYVRPLRLDDNGINGSTALID